jgi:predicted AlkP superfamily pyrophosphatase or phosphodiesterase
MLLHAPYGRVIVVVLDGLRPDAIPRFGLDRISSLARGGASTMLGRTVTPSVTASAMASLLTGAMPERHGLASHRFRIPRPTGVVHPLPRTLAAAGYASSIFISMVPFGFMRIANRISAHLGFASTGISGRDAHDVLATATPALLDQRRGLIVIHFPDADRAGHARGWMSDPYAAACRTLDEALGKLATMPAVAGDPGTLLVALADHGGGGLRLDQHDSRHPLDQTIPIILSGSGVVRRDLGAGSSILDIPPTICWALGIGRPESHAGRAMTHAFDLAAPRHVVERRAVEPAEAA